MESLAYRAAAEEQVRLPLGDNIIKTTKNLELKSEDFHQLLGYYALHEISGIGEITPKLEIKKVAIYYARYAYLHSLELQDIINRQTFPEFVAWFKARANKEYRPINKLP